VVDIDCPDGDIWQRDGARGDAVADGVIPVDPPLRRTRHSLSSFFQRNEFQTLTRAFGGFTEGLSDEAVSPSSIVAASRENDFQFTTCS
jgi:hypothetical protein